MKLQKRHGSIAGACLDCARARSLGDTKQETDHQITPQQPGELLGEVRRPASDQSGGGMWDPKLTVQGSLKLPQQFGDFTVAIDGTNRA